MSIKSLLIISLFMVFPQLSYSQDHLMNNKDEYLMLIESAIKENKIPKIIELLKNNLFKILSEEDCIDISSKIFKHIHSRDDRNIIYNFLRSLGVTDETIIIGVYKYIHLLMFDTNDEVSVKEYEKEVYRVRTTKEVFNQILEKIKSSDKIGIINLPAGNSPFKIIIEPNEINTIIKEMENIKIADFTTCWPETGVVFYKKEKEIFSASFLCAADEDPMILSFHYNDTLYAIEIRNVFKKYL